MGAVDWHDAKYADGAAVARWFDQNVNVKKDDDSALRRLYEWRVGGTASFLCIDRLLVRYDRHPSELPDEVWLAERPDREKRDKRVYGGMPAVKACEGCGEPISYRKPDGTSRGPKGYRLAKFCSRECSFQVLSGNRPPVVANA